MFEATRILLPAELRARLARAAITLAEREAEKHVKRQIAASGKKLSRVPTREIFAATREHLIANPQLIAEQRPVVEQWRREGFFGRKVARTVNILRQCVDSPTRS
jgi:hypothetical protein